MRLLASDLSILATAELESREAGEEVLRDCLACCCFVSLRILPPDHLDHLLLLHCIHVPYTTTEPAFTHPCLVTMRNTPLDSRLVSRQTSARCFGRS